MLYLVKDNTGMILVCNAISITLYKGRYTDAMASLKNLGDGKLRMDSYRDGQYRQPVV